MLASILERHGVPLGQVIGEAIEYFRGCQQPDGSIADDPTSALFREWDSVNVLKAIALWQEEIPTNLSDLIGSALRFLAAQEKSNGMLSYGGAQIASDKYCAEASSEYISALTLLGQTDRARGKANFLRDRQRPDGPWEEMHPHVPDAFQLEPSVTGFALLALDGLNIEPAHLDEALDFLASKQHSDGHFGINWYYYASHYYLMRSTVAALANFGSYAAVAMARDFVLAQQRPDGSWFSQADDAGTTAAPELHTALALATLAHAGMSTDEPAVRRAIGWLLDRRRPDGSWYGGDYPYPETDSYRDFRAPQDAFTTAQVLIVFKHLQTT
ncbi:MAG: terpene cyclase/mutase family protein [Mycobacterium sp.]|nr:terpene cyclase/mutase family protein [Mycobacterium sp.]